MAAPHTSARRGRRVPPRARKPDLADHMIRSQRTAASIFFEQLWNVLRHEPDTARYIAEALRSHLHGLRLGIPGYLGEDVTKEQRKAIAALRADVDLAYEWAGQAADIARARKWEGR